VTAERVVAALHPDDHGRVFAALLAASDPDVRRPYRIDYRTRAEVHGSEHWLSAQGTVFFSKAGKPLRLIGTVKDITERKRAEAELAQTGLFREQFIGVLGHDQRNPLSAIRASAELVLRKPLDPGQEKALSRIVHSSERMSRMISDVLDLARGHLGGGLPIHPQPTDLQELCRRVVDELRVAHPKQRLQLALEGNGRGEWDPDRVAQVISNLVGNALEHGAPDRPVRVKVSGAASAVTLEVHNEGPPIPEALLPVIFEPFRGTAAGRGRPRSLGLGLYIVQEIVRAHGGTVEARSTAEDGTTFRVQLPRVAAQP
jgi:signal transduction histidine kinase